MYLYFYITGYVGLYLRISYSFYHLIDTYLINIGYSNGEVCIAYNCALLHNASITKAADTHIDMNLLYHGYP